MRYLTFASPEPSSYEICFLVSKLNKADIRRLYIEPHILDQEAGCLAYSLLKQDKMTVGPMRAYLAPLVAILGPLQVRYLVVNDPAYYTVLTKHKATDSIGFVRPSTVGQFHVIYVPGPSQAFHNPTKTRSEIAGSLGALVRHQQGQYNDPGTDIIHQAVYPKTVERIAYCLEQLLEYPVLGADIECFSLKHYEAGIGTIAFAPNKNQGVAFAVDLAENPEDAPTIRALLKDFFCRYQGTLRWHKIDFDVTVLIYQLFMKDLIDTAGLLEGLSVLLRNWDCTRLISYLATNNTGRNILGLKALALEFSGNYAIEGITDIRALPIDKLLQYNLIDALSTNYVYEKNWPVLVSDQQEEIYRTLFQPSMIDIIQMQLTGMPLNMEEVQRFAVKITTAQDSHLATMLNNPIVVSYTDVLNQKWAAKRNAKLKVKRVTAAEGKEVFNPNSGPQLIGLLFEFLNLPSISKTDSGLDSTDGDTLEALLNHTQDPHTLDLLNAMIDYKAAQKIVSSFLPHLLAAPRASDGWHYLFGSFNLGGTVSGRMSSSDPNLQNLPANPKKRNKWAKDFKRCFQAPPGWLFAGLDFSSLEDRISALTTRDPNKLLVYTDGYDGHCLRAYSYFEEEMPTIIAGDVASINSIASIYPAQRQDSKSPTFALTYQGTFRTLMANCGFSEEKAKRIEKAYHELYRVSDQWVAARIAEAGRVGYAVLAFGLRLRTPLLKQVVLGTSRTPYEAEAEGRTVGNALGQSWGLLNNRAAIEFNGKVRASEYRLDIRPCAHIHDAQYHMIRDTMPVVRFANEHIVKAAQWNHDPLIYHPDVPLGGELSIYFPSWAEEATLPNGATEDEISQVCLKHAQKYNLI